MKRGSLVLAWILAAGLVAGCGDNKSTGDTDTTDTADDGEDTALDTAPDTVPDTAPDTDTDTPTDTETDTGEDVVPDTDDVVTDTEDDTPADAGDDPDADDADDADAHDWFSETSACPTLDPYGFGYCDMWIGWGWTGSTCESISGCSCTPWCSWFFTSEAACLTACSP